ncbi:MAG: PQQ-dependent sugar dehydrogenase [Vicinamibacterales bacterium]
MSRTFACGAILTACLAGVACKTEGTSASAQPAPSQPAPAQGPVITLDAASVQQTMSGWEVPTLTTVRDYFSIRPYVAAIMDQAANDLGINRISVGTAPGAENTSAACQQDYLDGVANEATFLRSCAYNPVNDNADPNVINPNGFHWLLLDWQIDTLVLPLRQRLEARGERLHVAVRYVDFIASAFEQKDNPAEYAEYMLALFQHLQQKYGFVPDSIDLINEPDLAVGWSDGGLIGRIAAATGQRLAAAGFRPEMTGPSTTNKAAAVPFFDAMIAQPGARAYLKEIGWHCYNDTGTNTNGTLSAKAMEYGVRTSQTECWTTGNTYQMLLRDLKESRNSSWSMGPIHAPNGYYSVTGTGEITLRDRAKYMRQYYRYVRLGARRIAATSSSDQFEPVAFVNTNGSTVVVVRAAAAGSFTIANLPAGTYGIYSTTGPDASTVSSFDVTAPDQTVGASGRLTTSIQGAGVITVFSRAAVQNRVSGGSDSVRVEPDVTATPTGTGLEASRPLEVAAPRSVVTRDGVRLHMEWLPGTVSNPVDLATAGAGRVLVAERSRVLVIRNREVLGTAALTLAPDDAGNAEELVAIAADPRFEQSHLVYAVSTTGGSPKQFRLSRYVEVNDTLSGRVVLLDGVPAADPAAATLRVGPDGTLFAAFDTGGDDGRMEDLGSYNGKLLRLNADGTTPRDQQGGTPLFAYGYHSPRGLGWDSLRSLWVVDGAAPARLDRLASDPSASARVVARFALPADLEPTSMVVYGSSAIPGFRNNLFVASDTGQALLRLMPDPGAPAQPPVGERLFEGELGGIRSVTVDAAGDIYIATSSGLARINADTPVGDSAVD